MSTKVITYKQDLPPPGGYAEFDWSRIPQSKFPSPNRQFLALVIITCLGLIGYEKEKLRHR
jgi:GRIM-19 protein